MKTIKQLINLLTKIDYFFSTSNIFSYLAYIQIIICSTVLLSFFDSINIIDVEKLVLTDFFWIMFLVNIAILLHLNNLLIFILKSFYNKFNQLTKI